MHLLIIIQATLIIYLSLLLLTRVAMEGQMFALLTDPPLGHGK